MIDNLPHISSRRDIFVSFTAADRAWATWIAWVLEEESFSVVFQDWDFRHNFVEEMHAAQKNTDRTLCVFSDAYFASKNATAEMWARFAEDPKFIIPVKVSSVSDLGLLRPLIYADLENCTEEEARERLMKVVRGPTRPTRKPAFPGARVIQDKPAYPLPFGSTSTGEIDQPRTSPNVGTSDGGTKLGKTKKKWWKLLTLTGCFIGSASVYFLPVPPVTDSKVCEDPKYGVKSYKTSSSRTISTSWDRMKKDQAMWCKEVTSTMRSDQPSKEISLVSSQEDNRSECPLPSCLMLYRYSCTMNIAEDPVYNTGPCS